MSDNVKCKHCKDDLYPDPLDNGDPAWASATTSDRNCPAAPAADLTNDPGAAAVLSALQGVTGQQIGGITMSGLHEPEVPEGDVISVAAPSFDKGGHTGGMNAPPPPARAPRPGTVENVEREITVDSAGAVNAPVNTDFFEGQNVDIVKAHGKFVVGPATIRSVDTADEFAPYLLKQGPVELWCNADELLRMVGGSSTAVMPESKAIPLDGSPSQIAEALATQIFDLSPRYAATALRELAKKLEVVDLRPPKGMCATCMSRANYNLITGEWHHADAADHEVTAIVVMKDDDDE